MGSNNLTITKTDVPIENIASLNKYFLFVDIKMHI